jgi:exonuclease III
MILAAWNVRGMNSPIKTKEVRNFLVGNNISVIGLMETKTKESNAKKIQKKLGNKWT